MWLIAGPSAGLARSSVLELSLPSVISLSFAQRVVIHRSDFAIRSG